MISGEQIGYLKCHLLDCKAEDKEAVAPEPYREKNLAVKKSARQDKYMDDLATEGYSTILSGERRNYRSVSKITKTLT